MLWCGVATRPCLGVTPGRRAAPGAPSTTASPGLLLSRWGPSPAGLQHIPGAQGVPNAPSTYFPYRNTCSFFQTLQRGWRAAGGPGNSVRQLLSARPKHPEWSKVPEAQPYFPSGTGRSLVSGLG